MTPPSLIVLVDCLELRVDVRPDKFDRAALRWRGQLELEAPMLMLMLTRHRPLTVLA